MRRTPPIAKRAFAGLSHREYDSSRKSAGADAVPAKSKDAARFGPRDKRGERDGKAAEFAIGNDHRRLCADGYRRPADPRDPLIRREGETPWNFKIMVGGSSSSAGPTSSAPSCGLAIFGISTSPRRR